MGLRPWNKISIEISHDDFNIVSSNLEFIKQRLECIVNPNSSISSDRTFKPDDTDDRIIKYYVLIL